MCNACGFLCCGWDLFSGCGCDGCDEPDCWDQDAEEWDDEPSFPDCRARLPHRPRLRCEGSPS